LIFPALRPIKIGHANNAASTSAKNCRMREGFLMGGNAAKLFNLDIGSKKRAKAA
jgi:hypothetical protein